MSITQRVFRVFVSSTFDDLIAERDSLHRRVFPRLRHLCERHGYRFQPIDLRWGITESFARRHQIMRICLSEQAEPALHGAPLVAQSKDITVRERSELSSSDRA